MTKIDNAAPKRARSSKDETAPAPRAVRSARRKPPTPDQAPLAPDASVDPAVATHAAGAKAGPGGKLGLVVGLLRRPGGATVAQISEATDWLPHSVRGAMAGALKKKHKLTITSEQTEGGRVYRLAEPAR